MNHASIIPNLTAQSSELRGLGASSRVVREGFSCGAMDPGLSGIQNWAKLQRSIKGSQSRSLGSHDKSLLVCPSPKCATSPWTKSRNLAIAAQSFPALWSALCLRKISANINHGTEWMFIGRDGGGGGEEGGGVCGANDGDREERGMFSPPSPPPSPPSRLTRVASTQNGKKSRG